jgi:competence protein ComEC
MVARGTYFPILSAVIGAAVSYYGFSVPRDMGLVTGYGVLLVIFFPVLPISLFRVLTSFPGELFTDPRRRRLCSALKIHITAFSLGLVLGLGAGGAVPRSVNLGLPEETVTGISGTLLNDPRALADGRGMAQISPRAAVDGRGTRASAQGRLTVFFPDETMPRLKDFGRGSLVYVEGRLAPGGEPLFRASSVHITKAAPALEQFRTGLRLGIMEKFSGGTGGGKRAWGGLALALLLGIRDNLDTELAGFYQKAGCSHVLALSGMHLAIVSSLIAFFLKRPLGLKAAAVTGAVFIFFYVFLVGSQPSLNRAALMYFLGTLAVLGTLPKKAGLLLGLAFLLQIVIWPESGLSISFILSYLALAGILTAGEALGQIFRGWIPGFLLYPLAASLGAFIATSAATAFFFGELRFIGIAAGLIIVPLTTLFMIGALAWLALSFLSPFLASFLGGGLSLLYALMDRLISLAARFPGIPVSRPFLVLALSLGLWAFIIWLGKRYAAGKRRLAAFA